MPSSTFRLTTAFRHGRTKIDDIYFEAPFKLMTPFTNGRHSDFIVMLASPGFLKGDEAHIEIGFGPGTDSTIKTQSYEKVLDTADGSASRTIALTARGDAKAVFLPFPVIPFRGSTFENLTEAHVSAESTFVYADVVTCGRVGMDERWAMRRFTNRLRVTVDEPAAVTAARVAQVSAERGGRRGRPTAEQAEAARVRSRLAFADRMLLEPDAFDYTDMGMWRRYTHCGVLYAHLPEGDAGAAGGGAAAGTAHNTEAAKGAGDVAHAGAIAATTPGATVASATVAAHHAAAPDPQTIAARIEQARIDAEDALIERIRRHAASMGFADGNGGAPGADARGEVGVSRAVNGVVVRVLTSRGDDAFDLIRDIADML